MEKYTINNTFSGETFFTEGYLSNTSQPVKFIRIPINMRFDNNGIEDVVGKIIQDEVNATINPFVDLETIKFNSAVYGTSNFSNLNIRFNFASDSSTFGNDFYKAGFTSDDINNKRNRLTRSFFKLDFYDNTGDTANFLFSEYLSVNLNSIPTFDFKRLFWIKEDQKFSEGISREVYFDVTFYSAKDGSIRKFLNKSPGAVSLTQYKSNPSWRFAKLKILNPFTTVNNTNSNYNRVFYVEPINGNTDNLITFSELIAV